MHKQLIFTLSLVVSSLFVIPCLQAQEQTIGEIRLFAGDFAPEGWAICDGSILEIATNQALFHLLGPSYGGDGTTNFALPDLRGRTLIGAGDGPGLEPQKHGDKTGAETVTLTERNLPVENTRVPAYNLSPEEADAAEFIHGNRSFISVGNQADTAVPTMGTSTNHPFSIVHSSLTLNYIIAIKGVFPSSH